MKPRQRASEPNWLSLGQTSRLLGVSEATLRRWSDSGRLKAFTTPGGHRRFSRQALDRLLPAGRERRPGIAAAGLTPTRIARAYRRDARSMSTTVPWLTTVPEQHRVQMRELGRRLAAALVAHLDAGEPENRAHHLAEGSAVAADYGRMGALAGRSLSDVVEGFLAFRRPFLAEVTSVARRRGFDVDEVAGLYDDAEAALDRLLVATMTGHSVASVARSRRGPRRTARPIAPPAGPLAAEQ